MSENIEIQERIDRYLNGELNRVETDDLWDLIIEYPEYLEFMKTCAGLRDMKASETGVGIRKQTAKPLAVFDFRYAVAAGIIIFLGVFGVLNIYQSETVFVPEPMNRIELDITRSAESANDVIEQKIQEGIGFAVTGRDEEALEILHSLLAQTEEVALKLDVMINIGIVHYNRADYEAAESAFMTVTENPQADPLVQEKAWWFLANTYLKTNHRDKAKLAAQYVYDVNGAYRRMAERWLDGL